MLLTRTAMLTANVKETAKDVTARDASAKSPANASASALPPMNAIAVPRIVVAKSSAASPPPSPLTDLIPFIDC